MNYKEILSYQMWILCFEYGDAMYFKDFVRARKILKEYTVIFKIT
jgi:hypothetical protein